MGVAFVVANPLDYQSPNRYNADEVARFVRDKMNWTPTTADIRTIRYLYQLKNEQVDDDYDRWPNDFNERLFRTTKGLEWARQGRIGN